MKLKDYLKRENLSVAQFAKKLGIAAFTVDRYLGGRIPDSRVVVKIHRATKGAVQPNDLYKLPTSSGKASHGNV